MCPDPEPSKVKAILGKPPPSIPSYMRGSSNNEVVNSLLAIRGAIHSSLKCRLTKAQDAMKYYADKKHRRNL